MRYYLAPMEGITGYIYRNAHRRIFGGADRYFTPFITPTQSHSLTTRELRDVAPEHNPVPDVVPQIMTANAEHFCWTAAKLACLGYAQVDLNLGCPSRTVVCKGRGAGLLARLDALDELLDGIFSGTDLAVSVKTRIGLDSKDALERLIDIFNRYPICELTVHPRLQVDYYNGTPDLEAFERILRRSSAPVAYNGNLFTAADVADARARFGAASALMLGRGAIADPALLRRAQGGPPASRAELVELHAEVLDGYMAELRDPLTALFRMKELWTYMGALFDDVQPYLKRIRKAARLPAYADAVRALFDECDSAPDDELGARLTGRACDACWLRNA